MDEQSLSDQTADLLGLADVERWGVVKTARPQSVAEHSFSVAVLARDLAVRMKLPVGDELLWWALIHDTPETLTGDIDGKFKRDNLTVRRALELAEDHAFPWHCEMKHGISNATRYLVKLADKIEAMVFIGIWGIGPRADDILRELGVILFKELVPIAADGLGLDDEFVETHVRDVLHTTQREGNNIQLRRHRRHRVGL